MKKNNNNPAQRAGEKNNLAPILSENIFARTKKPKPPPLNIKWTVSKKAVGTIWRALPKPPQRRKGPDPRPLDISVIHVTAQRFAGGLKKK